MTLSHREEVFEYSNIATEVSLDDVASLYESVGFGSADDYTRDAKIKNALFGPGVHAFFARMPESRSLVGMARVFSDDRFCTWIAEICVNPKYQRLGVGRKLMTLVLERFGHTAIYLEAFANGIDFFRKVGVKPKEKLVACSLAAQKMPLIEPEPFKH